MLTVKSVILACLGVSKMAGKFFWDMKYPHTGTTTRLEMRILDVNECILLYQRIKKGVKEHPEEYINEVND